MSKKLRCFLKKFTQLTKILHDRRSRRSRQIPSLHQHNNCNKHNNNSNKFNKPNLMWTTELDWRVSWRNRVKKTPSKLARLLSILWPIEQSDKIKEEQKPSARKSLSTYSNYYVATICWSWWQQSADEASIILLVAWKYLPQREQGRMWQSPQSRQKTLRQDLI